MREHLQTSPEPHKTPLLGYHQALVPTFPKMATESPHSHQVWSGHNQLLIFIIHLPLANAWSCSLAREGGNMHVLIVLFLEICPFFPTILFNLVALSSDTCLPQGTLSKFDPDTPIPQDLWACAHCFRQSSSSSSRHCFTIFQMLGPHPLSHLGHSSLHLVSQQAMLYVSVNRPLQQA